MNLSQKLERIKALEEEIRGLKEETQAMLARLYQPFDTLDELKKYADECGFNLEGQAFVFKDNKVSLFRKPTPPPKGRRAIQVEYAGKVYASYADLARQLGIDFSGKSARNAVKHSHIADDVKEINND